MPSSSQARARSSKVCAGERKACPETAAVQERDAASMRVARSSEGMVAMLGAPGQRAAPVPVVSGGQPRPVPGSMIAGRYAR